MDVIVLIGPGVAADERLLREMAAREFAALGVEGRVALASGTDAFRAGLDAAGDDQAVVAIPGSDPDARRLIGTSPACSPRTVWLDFARVGPTQAAGGAAHLQGRGVWGLAWAVRHAVHRLRRPARRIPYGDHPDQWGELRLPPAVAGPPPSSGTGPAGSAAVPSDSTGVSPGSTVVPTGIVTGVSPGSTVVPTGIVTGVSPGSTVVPTGIVTGVSPGPAVVPTGATGVSPDFAGASAASAGGSPPVSGEASLPVVVLVHGGYWRSIWEADLMDALAIDLADRGYAAWNLEYRRPDLHGWDATTGDVAAGLAALTAIGAPLDLARVAVLGHSAGGQLALRLAADTAAGSSGRDAGTAAASSGRGAEVVAASCGGEADAAGEAWTEGGRMPVRVAVAVSLAGVLDLAEADRRRMGAGAVAAALGGAVHDIPEVYAAASPLERLPLGVPQLVVQGADDDPDLVDIGRRYARAAGREAVHIEQPGDHFAVIDPGAPIWNATVDHLAAQLRP
ncbi:alpha/beta hydrolase fold domain-containing protein [Sphaerisporangium dianthi]|uniref:Alpha/beta hydrolase fold domain-containing protein n=1 Tax=Sphaerisporangium dianthi TaxID=1436120 RepID=A0ABV9CUZ1_9ACTN